MINETSSQLKSRARAALLGRYGLPMGAFILTYLITMALETLVNFLLPGNTAMSIVPTIALLIIMIFSTLFQTGYQGLLLNMARGKEYQLKDLISPFQNMPDHVILLAVRLFLLSFACILPFLFGVTALLMMPSVLLLRVVCALLFVVSFFLALRVSLIYSQVFLIYLDNPYLPCGEVMRRSKQMMTGNCIRYFYLLVSFIGIALLGILSFGIGLLWIVPYVSMTEVEFYRDLIHEH